MKELSLNIDQIYTMLESTLKCCTFSNRGISHIRGNVCEWK